MLIHISKELSYEEITNRFDITCFTVQIYYRKKSKWRIRKYNGFNHKFEDRLMNGKTIYDKIEKKFIVDGRDNE